MSSFNAFALSTTAAMSLMSSAVAAAQGVTEPAQTGPVAPGSPARQEPDTAAGSPVKERVDQAAAGEGIADIVVTAQRRSSSVQNTPLAITAVNAETLANRQIQDLQDLVPALPSVAINPTLGSGRIAIRGIGLDTTQTGGEGRVAYHVDGVYFSRPTSTLGSQFDVDRIEVVRGPQGTLYGRNATAGAINVITPDPGKLLSGYGRITAGNYGLVRGEAAIDLPYSSTGGLRIAGQVTSRGGYGKNLTTGRDINNAKTQSARATIKQALGDAITVRLSADYHHENDANYAFYYLGQGNPLVVPLAQRNGGVVALGYDTTANFQQRNRRTFYGGSLHTTADLGGATLTSITGYRHSDTRFSGDADGTNFAAGVSNQFERAHQFSEELRVSGDFARGDYLFGLYYFSEHINGRNAFSPLNQLIVATGTNRQIAGFTAGGLLDTKAYAVFGEAHFDLVDHLRLVAGGRYSYETKEAREFTVLNTTAPFVPDFVFVPTRTSDQRADWRSFTPRIGLEYKPRPGLLVYATYSQGFKSGGFALGALQRPVEPETLKNYELGLKADLLDRKLRANLSLYHYDYTNLQVSKVVTGGTQLVNAAKAKLTGVEAEITALPATGLQFDVTASLLKSKYTDFQTSDPSRPTLGVLDLEGNRLSQALPYTVDLGAQYSWGVGVGDLTLRGEANWSGRSYFNPFNRRELSQDAYAKFNAFLNFVAQDSNWTAGLFARNIGNRRTVSFAYTSNPLFGTPIIGAYAPPRTYGATLGYKF